mmetsp:Transcript_28121/g.46729  ORF Transcript_28121/g.46729 Transcript_28121/m.46729 type:complete len:207 (-) Transcript_28121:327-947(-)
MSLNFHHLWILAEPVCAALADRGLVLANSRSIDDSACANADVIVLRENPCVEIGRNVVTDIHLRQIFIVLHLVVGDLDSFLKSNCIVVLTGINGLSNARVGAVGTNNYVKLCLSWRALARPLALVICVLDRVRTSVLLWHLHFLHEPIDRGRAKLDCTITQEAVQNLAASHADVLVWLQRSPNVHLAPARRDHFHLAHAPVDDLRR